MKTILKTCAGGSANRACPAKFPDVKITERQKFSAWRDLKRENGHAEKAPNIGGYFFRPMFKGLPLKTVWGSDLEDVRLFLISQRVEFDRIISLH